MNPDVICNSECRAISEDMEIDFSEVEQLVVSRKTFIQNHPLFFIVYLCRKLAGDHSVSFIEESGAPKLWQSKRLTRPQNRKL